MSGKTGTAEATDDAGADVYHASFAGSVLDREPRFVALVRRGVPEGKAAGPTAAAPAWARLASRILSDLAVTVTRRTSSAYVAALALGHARDARERLPPAVSSARDVVQLDLAAGARDDELHRYVGVVLVGLHRLDHVAVL